MKKMGAWMLCMVLMVLAVVGCGNQYTDNEFVGTWQASEAEKSDITVNVEDVFGVVRFTFDANGKAVLLVGEEKTHWRWTPLEKGIEVRREDTTIHMKKIKGNVIAGDFNGIKISFERVDDQ